MSNKLKTLLARLIVLFILLVLISVSFILSHDNKKISRIIIEPANAQEIYNMFACPCCGNPISENCCNMAIERQSYVNGMIDSQADKEQIIDSYIKKYGIDSVLDENVKKEYLENLKENAPENAAQIVLAEDLKDLGEVSAQKGVVSTEFNFTNQGNSDLTINKLDTSCGCTSAAVVIDGQESPRFNMEMHGTNPTDYRGIIKPGQTAQIRVYYDPNVHQGLTGPVTRFVKIFSNDPVNFETKVTIKLNQVP